MRGPFTNVVNDRAQLANMAGQTKAAMGADTLDVLADRGYFSGEEVLACEPLVAPYVPSGVAPSFKKCRLNGLALQSW
jgi:hypothetical protein